MTKPFRILFLLLLTMASLRAAAQIYVTDDILTDSINVYEFQLSKDGKSETYSNLAFKLPMGDTVVVERLLAGSKFYGVVTFDGKKYCIGKNALVFSDENPEGVEDIFGNTRSLTRHTATGKFFASSTPYLLIAICFLIAMVFLILGAKKYALRKAALIAVPACILLGSALEIWAYSVLGSDSFWWCDPKTYGFFGALLRLLPFVAIVFFQVLSIKYYMALIADDDDNDLSVKPLLISIAVSVPLAVVAAIVGAGVFDLKKPWIDILTLGTFLLSLLIGLTMATRRNISELGKMRGILFTIFGIVWSIATIVSLIGVVIVIFRLIVQAIILGGAFWLLLFGSKGSSKSGSSSSSSSFVTPKKDPIVFRDDVGRSYNNAWDRDQANKRMRENKS